jgi:hypothetical protein
VLSRGAVALRGAVLPGRNYERSEASSCDSKGAWKLARSAAQENRSTIARTMAQENRSTIELLHDRTAPR